VGVFYGGRIDDRVALRGKSCWLLDIPYSGLVSNRQYFMAIDFRIAAFKHVDTTDKRLTNPPSNRKPLVPPNGIETVQPFDNTD
jgi:hypothetical protein